MFGNRTRKAAGLLSPLLAQVKATAAGKGARAQLGSFALNAASGNDLLAFLTLPSVSSELPQSQPWESTLSRAKVSGNRQTSICNVLCLCKQVLLCIQLCNFPPVPLELGTEGEGWMLYLPKLVVWYTINIFFSYGKIKRPISLKISLFFLENIVAHQK